MNASSSRRRLTAVASILFSLAVLLLSACGPARVQVDEQATAAAARLIALWTAQAPTLTPQPTATRAPTPTPTALPAPVAVVLAGGLNVREGPGTEYANVGRLAQNDEVEVVGQFGGCAWLQVKARGQDLAGWVSGEAAYIRLDAVCETVAAGTFRPPTGVISPNQRTGGLGQLTVDNGTAQDGVVILTFEEQPFLAAYVRAGESATLTGISDGVYDLYFSTGSDWDGKQFLANPRRQRFEDPFAFRTDATTYSIWNVTLHAVEGGTAASDDVAAGDFPELAP